MRPGPDDEGDGAPIPRSEGGPAGPDQVARETVPGAKPFTGGYYWLPNMSHRGIAWSLVTCRDLDCGRDAGHDADLWPRLMGPLAEAWGKDVQVLKRMLALSYTGLPRGRVTRPGKTFLVLHGNDSPTRSFEEVVTASFGLSNRRVWFVFDEHETLIPGHSRAIEVALGLRLYGPGV